MPAYCSVLSCKNRGMRDDVSFYRLPTLLNFKQKPELNELSRIRRQKWLEALRRRDLTSQTSQRHARVCSRHFVSGQPALLADDTNVDWVPTLHMGYNRDVASNPQSEQQKNKPCIQYHNKRVTNVKSKEDSTSDQGHNKSALDLSSNSEQYCVSSQPPSPYLNSDSDTLSCCGDDMLDDQSDMIDLNRAVDNHASNYILNSPTDHDPNYATSYTSSSPQHFSLVLKNTYYPNSENKTDQDNEEEVCQTCICCLDSNGVTNIFNGVYESSIVTRGLSDVPLSQIFSSLVGIELQEDSNFEHVICDECLELLTSFYDFKLKVIHSYMYMLKQNPNKVSEEHSEDLEGNFENIETELIETSCDDISVTTPVSENIIDPEPNNQVTCGLVTPHTNGFNQEHLHHDVDSLVDLNEAASENYGNEVTQNIYINLETNEQIDFEEVSKMTNLDNIVRLDVALPNEIIENLQIFNPNNSVTQQIDPNGKTNIKFSQKDLVKSHSNGQNTSSQLPSKRQKLDPHNVTNADPKLLPKKRKIELGPSTKFKMKNSEKINNIHTPKSQKVVSFMGV